MRMLMRGHWSIVAALVAVAICAVGFNGSDPARAAEMVTLNLYISGDTNIFDLWKKALLPAFTKRYPQFRANMVELLHGNGSDGIYDKILAAKRAARTVDVDLWETEPGFLDQGITDGLWVKLSEKLVPNIAKVPVRTLEAAGQQEPAATLHDRRRHHDDGRAQLVVCHS